MDRVIQISALVILCLVCGNRCIETLDPEFFLQPRNFNPHPFLEPENPLDRSGPVLFPGNALSLPHPYAKLADRRKGTQESRFNDETNLSNPTAFSALAKYAATKLKKNKQDQLAKQYAFSYTIHDPNPTPTSGDDFSHYQHSIGYDVTDHGQYHVPAPDGRAQFIRYTTDNGGYHAGISYNPNGEITVAPLHQNPLNEPLLLPVQSGDDFHPKLTSSNINYNYNNNNHNNINENGFVNNNVGLLTAVKEDVKSLSFGSLRGNNVLYSHAVNHDEYKHHEKVNGFGRVTDENEVENGGNVYQHGGGHVFDDIYY